MRWRDIAAMFAAIVAVMAVCFRLGLISGRAGL